MQRDQSISKFQPGFFPYLLTEFEKSYLLRCHPFPKEVFEKPFFYEGARLWLDQNNPAPTRLLNLVETGAIRSLNVSPPVCVIFHLGRCGSTLLSQMFASINRYRVVSEPGVINTLLKFEIEDSKKALMLKALIDLYAQNIEKEEQPLVLKLTSWNIFEVERFRRLMPDVPFIFLYRDPREVMASLLQDPHGMVRGKKNPPKAYCRYLNASRDQVQAMSQEEYVARILGGILEKMISVKHGNLEVNCQAESNIFISYDQLMPGCQDLFRDRFNFSDAEMTAVLNRSAYRSKGDTSQKFIADGTEKRRMLTEKALKHLKISKAMEFWHELESI